MIFAYRRHLIAGLRLVLGGAAAAAAAAAVRSGDRPDRTVRVADIIFTVECSIQLVHTRDRYIASTHHTYPAPH